MYLRRVCLTFTLENDTCMRKQPPAADNRRERKNASHSERSGLRTRMGRPWIFWVTISVLVVIQIARLVGDEITPNQNLIRNPGVFSLLSYLTLAILVLGFVILSFLHVWEGRFKVLQRIGIILVALSCLLVTALSFNPRLAPNGDNAEYVISAKSLVDHGSVKRLYVPGEPTNSLASLGLPLMLSPIYKIWGLDILKMKVLVFILSLIAIPLLFLIFNSVVDTWLSLLLTLVGATSPYLISSSSSIMTEIPYWCFSLATLYVGTRYQQSQKFNVFLFLLLLILCFISYIIRPVSISLVLAIVCLLLSQVRWYEGWVNALRGLPFRKLIYFSTVLAVAFGVWQLKQSQEGLSQTTLFLKGSITDRFFENTFALSNVLSQIILSSDTFLWFRNAPDVGLPPRNIFWMILSIVTLVGIGKGILKKHLLAWYVVFFSIITLLASYTPQERVMVRYFSVIIPFLIYYFALGVNTILNPLLPKSNKKMWTRLLSVISVGLICTVNLSGNRHNMLVKSAVYNDYYDSFLRAAHWCGQNLDSTSYVMSVKPRIVYLYSGLKGVDLIGDRDVYSEEWARAKLVEMRDRGITHIIVDVISKKTQETVFPLLQDHPAFFRRLDVPGLDEKCTVVEVLNIN